MHAIVANDDATGRDVANEAADQDENVDSAHADHESYWLLLRSKIFFQDLHSSLVAMVTQAHTQRRRVHCLVESVRIGNSGRDGRGAH